MFCSKENPNAKNHSMASAALPARGHREPVNLKKTNQSLAEKLVERALKVWKDRDEKLVPFKQDELEGVVKHLKAFGETLYQTFSKDFYPVVPPSSDARKSEPSPQQLVASEVMTNQKYRTGLSLLNDCCTTIGDIYVFFDLKGFPANIFGDAGGLVEVPSRREDTKAEAMMQLAAGE